MKNVFLQKEFGKCLFFCLANLFNDKSIIDNGSLEGYHVDGRRIIEKLMPGFSLGYKALHHNQMKPIMDENVFSYAFDTEKGEMFVPYITSTISNTKEKYNHSMLVLFDVTSKLLHILDPQREFAEEMTTTEFLQNYELMEVEVIIELKQGGTASFRKNDFPHLFIDERI